MGTCPDIHGARGLLLPEGHDLAGADGRTAVLQRVIRRVQVHEHRICVHHVVGCRKGIGRDHVRIVPEGDVARPRIGREGIPTDVGHVVLHNPSTDNSVGDVVSEGIAGPEGRRDFPSPRAVVVRVQTVVVGDVGCEVELRAIPGGGLLR